MHWSTVNLNPIQIMFPIESWLENPRSFEWFRKESECHI